MVYLTYNDIHNNIYINIHMQMKANILSLKIVVYLHLNISFGSDVFKIILNK